MDNNQLIQEVSTSLVWEVIGNYVERLDQQPLLLKDIGYIGDPDAFISQTTFCEVLNSDWFDEFFDIDDPDMITIKFEMPFILTTWNEEKALLRITSCAVGSCRIPSSLKYPWADKRVDQMNHPQLLSLKDLVQIDRLEYEQTECDDVSIL